MLCRVPQERTGWMKKEKTLQRHLYEICHFLDHLLEQRCESGDLASQQRRREAFGSLCLDCAFLAHLDARLVQHGKPSITLSL